LSHGVLFLAQLRRALLAAALPIFSAEKLFNQP
jgi:2-polyprenyl-3-methyl-5-hydroxy-6-metoxy-1,4-benzoquinol methylase